MMNKLEEMKKAYADYPTQDNEGYVPDRAGFKAGFFAAWNLLARDNERHEAAGQTITSLQNRIVQMRLAMEHARETLTDAIRR